jgi:hypothetical protein
MKCVAAENEIREAGNYLCDGANSTLAAMRGQFNACDCGDTKIASADVLSQLGQGWHFVV